MSKKKSSHPACVGNRAKPKICLRPQTGPDLHGLEALIHTSGFGWKEGLDPSEKLRKARRFVQPIQGHSAILRFAGSAGTLYVRRSQACAPVAAAVSPRAASRWPSASLDNPLAWFEHLPCGIPDFCERIARQISRRMLTDHFRCIVCPLARSLRRSAH
jgi:hypothetical protein